MERSGSGFRNLLLITVVLAAGAIWAWTRQSGGHTPEGAGEKVFPGLSESLNDIDRVVAEGSHGTFTLARRGGEWFLDEWAGFPANFETVKAVVVGAESLVIDAPKTKRPDRWADLGVGEPGEGSNSVRLALSAGGETVAELIVGNTKGRDAVYVRRVGEDQTWLARGRLSPPRLGTGWVESEILSLPAERIARVVIQHPDGERLTIQRTGDGPGDWELRELEPGHELKSPGLLSAVPSGLSRLSFESVVLAVDVDAELPEWTSTRYETGDGIAVTVRTAEVDGKTVARLSAEALPQPDPAEGPQPTVATERSPQEIAAEVAALQAHAGTWTYVLPSWKVSSLVKRMEDLVQPMPPGEGDATLEALQSVEGGGQDG